MNPAADPGPKHRWQLEEFVVDPVRRVLLREGEPVAVTPKAFSILLALLEKPGAVVTKQELIQRIWPNTFVTEANLTQNVSSLRKALGESANERRFIVTIPGRGYSLAVPVVPLEELEEGEETPAEEAAPPPPAPSEPVSGARSAVQLEAVPQAPRATPAVRGQRSRLSPVAIALAVLAAMVAIWLGGRHREGNAPAVAPAPTAMETPLVPAAGAQRTTIAVLGFRNLTGDKEAEWLGPALAEMLTTEMGAGSRVRVISGDNIQRARQAVSSPAADHLERAEMDRLHSLLGADLVVVGAYLSLGRGEGQRLRLDLRVLKLPDGDMVASASESGRQAELFDLIARGGHDLRAALGIADLSEAEEKAVRALRPASPEAARLYTQGLASLRASNPPAARDLLLQAVQEDPNSAVIHSALSQTWAVLGYDGLAVEEARKALALSGSLAREERLAIEARFQEASKEWGKASDTYRTLWSFFPDDLEYGLQLTSALMTAGRTEEALVTIAALRRLPDPSAQDARIDLLESRIAYRRADTSAQRRAAAAAIEKGRRSNESLVVAEALVMDGVGLQAIGKADEAIEQFQQAKTLAERGGYQWVSGMALASLGAVFQARGDIEAAQAADQEALAIAQKLGTATGMSAELYALGLLAQDRGDLRESFKLFEQSRVWSVRSGDRAAETRLTRVIATIQQSQGDLTAALQSAEHAIVLSRESGSRLEEALSLQARAAALDLQDDLDGARHDYLRAFQILRELGNTSIEANALAAMADVMVRQGDIAGARRRLEHALAAKRRIRDRLGEARILGFLAELAYQTGDLEQYQALSRQQLAIAQASGAQSIAASAFQSLGRVQMAGGDLAAAWSSYQAVEREFSRLGEEVRATAVRVDLARVALADNRAAEAVNLARAAAAWYGERGMRGRQAATLAVLAEAYARAGSAAGAEEMASRAEVLVAKSKDRALRLAVSIRVARVEAASDTTDAPLAALRAAIAEADKAGLVALSLEARLALGEIQVARHDRQGTATLAALRADAAARGYVLLARLAGTPQAPQPLRPLG